MFAVVKMAAAAADVVEHGLGKKCSATQIRLCTCPKG